MQAKFFICAACATIFTLGMSGCHTVKPQRSYKNLEALIDAFLAVTPVVPTTIKSASMATGLTYTTQSQSTGSRTYYSGPLVLEDGTTVSSVELRLGSNAAGPVWLITISVPQTPCIDPRPLIKHYGLAHTGFNPAPAPPAPGMSLPLGPIPASAYTYSREKWGLFAVGYAAYLDLPFPHSCLGNVTMRETEERDEIVFPK